MKTLIFLIIIIVAVKFFYKKMNKNNLSKTSKNKDKERLKKRIREIIPNLNVDSTYKSESNNKYTEFSNIDSVKENNIITSIPTHLKTLDVNEIIIDETNTLINQKIECYMWLSNKGQKLTFYEIKKFFLDRAKRSAKTGIRMNYEAAELQEKFFKFYNGYCFYEVRNLNGGRDSFPFNGKLKGVFAKDGFYAELIECKYAKEVDLEHEITNLKDHTNRDNKILKINMKDINYNNGLLIYKNVPFTGIGFNLYDDGKLHSENEIIEGVTEGSFRIYHKNGKIQFEGIKSKNNVLIGDSIAYHENGQKYIEGTSDEKGKKTGPYKVYFNNGQIKTEGTYKDDRKIGIQKEYYKSGKKCNEINFIDGKANGLYKHYYESGEKMLEVTILNDKVVPISEMLGGIVTTTTINALPIKYYSKNGISCRIEDFKLSSKDEYFHVLLFLEKYTNFDATDSAKIAQQIFPKKE